jgi:translation initiation factor 1
VCDTLDKEKTQKIKVYATSKKFRKLVTIIEGIDKNKLHEVTKKLKQSLACGGTHKGEQIILQGDHTKKVKGLLVKLGYPEDVIDVTGRI